MYMYISLVLLQNDDINTVLAGAARIPFLQNITECPAATATGCDKRQVTDN